MYVPLRVCMYGYRCCISVLDFLFICEYALLTEGVQVDLGTWNKISCVSRFACVCLRESANMWIILKY
jgi:hypothetical protein